MECRCYIFKLLYIKLNIPGQQVITLTLFQSWHTHARTHTCMHTRTHTAGLKPGRVNRVFWVNQVTFCPGRVGMTRFMNYPGLIQILHWITYTVITASCLDKIMNEACLMVIMEAYLLILLKIFQWSDCLIRVFWSMGAWITHSCTLHQSIVLLYTTIFISLCIKFYQWSFIGLALVQHDRRFCSCKYSLLWVAGHA